MRMNLSVHHSFPKPPRWRIWWNLPPLPYQRRETEPRLKLWAVTRTICVVPIAPPANDEMPQPLRRYVHPRFIQLDHDHHSTGYLTPTLKEPPDRDHNTQKFNAYIDGQVGKLINAQRREDRSVYKDWNGFLRVARRTAEGIRRFDSSLGTYVDKAIDDRSVEVSTHDASGIIDAVRETKELYDGQDPGYAPF